MMMADNPKLRYRSLWLLIGYALISFVIYLSVTSTPPDPGIDIPFIDKFYHAFAYFALMFWFAQIYHINKQKYLWAVFLVMLGVLMEYIQNSDPKRQYEIADMVANASGVIIGVLLAKTTLKNILVDIERLL